MKYKNDNGTFNGAKMLADVSGLSMEEILWTANRMKQLLAEGRSKDEAKAVVALENKFRPWK